jgi:predicted metalloprotease with PDZ domain
MQIVGEGTRPQHVRLELPEGWQAYAGLDHPNEQTNEFVAPNYDVLADSPILAGKDFAVTEFDVEGVRHVLVDAGDRTHWDSEKADANVKRVVQGTYDFWGQLPFKRYVFLNTLTNSGGGGLEHLYSTLISSRPNPNPDKPTESSFYWLKFVSHEYFHTFNVKRLRPIELGPFDYERPPRTPSLWISEGLTSYYGDLIVCRVGLATPEDFLGSMSSYIRDLQNCPGPAKAITEPGVDGRLDEQHVGNGSRHRQRRQLLCKGSRRRLFIGCPYSPRNRRQAVAG